MDNDEVDFWCSSCGWHGEQDEVILEDMGEDVYCPECGADLGDE